MTARELSETVPPFASNATVAVFGRITTVSVAEMPLNAALTTTVRDAVVWLAVRTPDEVIVAYDPPFESDQAGVTVAVVPSE